MNEMLRVFAHKASNAVSSKYAFLVAFAAVMIWAAVGPHYHYSVTWQLVINTGTTIITFLMVFIIQYTQARDTRAIQLKLDELVHSIRTARNSLVDVEEQSDETLEKLHDEFKDLREDEHTPRSPQPEPANGGRT